MDLAESRQPLDLAVVRTTLGGDGWSWQSPVAVVGTSGAGPALDQLADPGSPDLSTVVLEAWDGGIGPFAGSDLPPGSALVVSVLVTDSDAGDPGWLPLLGALAAADALRTASRVPAEVLWPDVITVPGTKCGGDAGSLQVGSVRVERVDSGLVLTVVIAVGISATDLPAGTSSIYSEGGSIDRAAILARLLPDVALRVEQWRSGDPALAADYRERCQSLGRLTAVPEGPGMASDVDDAGNLVVTVDGTPISTPPPHRLHGSANH
jgi:BirA family transcriptional regulator, biotin operon repressor / biotin---[acetyl-CoA-carboxylase] ligase